MPVSYTHLDVYKRQLLRKAEQKRLLFTSIREKLDTIRKMVTDSLTPVSYTHLDVYKRQAGSEYG